MIVIFLLLNIFLGSAKAYAPHYAVEKQTGALRWKSGLVKIALSNSLVKTGPNIRTDSDVAGAVARSLEAWEKVSNVDFDRSWSEKQSVSPTGNFGDGVSLVTIAQTPENLLLFSKDSEEVSARTRVFFNKKGFITEADIVLNPYQQFSTDGAIGTFDLESILTHEIGHLLGLEHSQVFGATMHENNAKNGVFNLPSFASRTLAATDISLIRAIYGARAETDAPCCGAISGRLSTTSGKAAGSVSVWAEDADTGRVLAETLTGANGSFHLDGLDAGRYLIFSQDLKDKGAAARQFEEIELASGKSVHLTKTITDAPSNFDLQYVGFNGQLSRLSVPLNGGKSYVVYLGGQNLDPKKLRVGFNARAISITPDSLVEHDYGDDFSVISLEIKVSPKILPGEYSLFVENEKGEKKFIPGALTIEEFVNPWNSNILLND